jgi:hypothetical protein
MNILGFPYGMPGQDALLNTVANSFLIGDSRQYHLVPIVLSSTALDSTNSPTYELRPGLVLGKITSTGEFKEFDATSTDGSQNAAGILYGFGARMQDYQGNSVDRLGAMVVRGLVRPGALYGFTEKARRDLSKMFWFDDRIPGVSLDWLGPTAKTADYTVVAADNGTHFTTKGAAGAVIFTLPAIGAGYRFRFTAEADQNMTVTAPANKLVTFNNLTATSVAFSTAGNKIGASVEIVSNSDGTKFIALPHGANTMTVA